MTTVIATIKPHHLHNIRTGKKLWEVRKTAPNTPIPFKVLCCESGSGGQIKAEFVCDEIKFDKPSVFGGYATLDGLEVALARESCLTQHEIDEYAGNKTVKFWHISNMIDYCKTKGYRVRNIGEFGLKRAPQSWQYVHETGC